MAKSAYKRSRYQPPDGITIHVSGLTYQRLKLVAMENKSLIPPHSRAPIKKAIGYWAESHLWQELNDRQNYRASRATGTGWIGKRYVHVRDQRGTAPADRAVREGKGANCEKLDRGCGFCERWGLRKRASMASARRRSGGRGMGRLGRCRGVRVRRDRIR